ncbi:hypothetical protein K439DRAFT_1647169 [Ramaria rubella]|nr:hypothetical protein K439DRAFT_1647169 [Ramaria rubella]
MYSSSVFHDAHQEKVVAALMVWSDSTHLTQFGTAHLWPIYFFLAQPNSHSYSIQDFIRESLGGQASSFIQAVWNLLLDKEFLMAYKQGIVILCADGVLHHVFLHLFTYSADYPEKMLMLSFKDKGHCPCPRCLVTKKEIHKLGLQRDRKRHVTRSCMDTCTQLASVSLARKFMYGKCGHKVNSTAVNNLLQATSLVPTENTFSKTMTSYLYNKFVMFVINLMHEFELGVWKAVLTHLIRLLSELGADKVNELNQR